MLNLYQYFPISFYYLYFNQFYSPKWAPYVLFFGDGGRKGQDAQTSLPDFTLKGLSCFYCHTDRLLPEKYSSSLLCFFFFFFLECSFISSVFSNQIESWRSFPSSLVYPSSCTHCNKQEKEFSRMSSSSLGRVPFIATSWDLLAEPLYHPSCFLLLFVQPLPGLDCFESPFKNFGVYKLYVPWLHWKWNLCNLINSFVRFTEEFLY